MDRNGDEYWGSVLTRLWSQLGGGGGGGGVEIVGSLRCLSLGPRQAPLKQCFLKHSPTFTRSSKMPDRVCSPGIHGATCCQQLKLKFSKTLLMVY